jgi:hypothetical protein
VQVCTTWDWRQEEADFGCKPIWVQGGANETFPNMLIAMKELGSKGGTWLWVVLHQRTMQQLLEAMA